MGTYKKGSTKEIIVNFVAPFDNTESTFKNASITIRKGKQICSQISITAPTNSSLDTRGIIGKKTNNDKNRLIKREHPKKNKSNNIVTEEILKQNIKKFKCPLGRKRKNKNKKNKKNKKRNKRKKNKKKKNRTPAEREKRRQRRKERKRKCRELKKEFQKQQNHKPTIVKVL